MHSGRMSWVGDGERVWFARVEHFVTEDRQDTRSAFDALGRLLKGSGRGPAVDHGTGMARGEVLGLTFLVHANDPASACELALTTAEAALGDQSEGLYGITLISDIRGSQGTRATQAQYQDSPGFPPLLD